MAFSTKLLKGRIKSIKNTKKLTKAMELVAAAKMRKSVQNVLASRSYADFAWDLLTRVKKTTDFRLSRFLGVSIESKRELMVLIASNRGLCGGYNTQVIRQALEKAMEFESEGKQFDFVIVGKKAREVMYRYKKNIVADFVKDDVITQVNEIFSLSRFVFNEFSEARYDAVSVAYTDYVSALKQVPRIRKILPIMGKDEWLGQIGNDSKEAEKPRFSVEYEYLFEPGTNAVLAQLLPRLIEVQLYQAYLEANASEHSSRMMAMRNATEAASDLIFDLELTFNQVRQGNITREIAEISAGKAVLEG
jgi:F-type H+-transporting ATPase subunit gamma